MPIAAAPWTTSATQGVAQRGCVFPRKPNVRPSRAIAYVTRGLARKLPLSAPNTLVMIASMVRTPPTGPAIAVMTVRAMASFCRAMMPTGIMYK